MALKDSVRHAIEAGSLLLEAKEQLKHGQWLPWLRDHCIMSERTTQLYMRCAKSRETIEKQIRNGVADLSLNEAAAMLALSSDMKKLFDFVRQLERLSDPEEIMQLCLDSGTAQFMGSLDYELSYGTEQRREWDLFILFLVRHIRWPAWRPTTRLLAQAPRLRDTVRIHGRSRRPRPSEVQLATRSRQMKRSSCGRTCSPKLRTSTASPSTRSSAKKIRRFGPK